MFLPAGLRRSHRSHGALPLACAEASPRLSAVPSVGIGPDSAIYISAHGHPYRYGHAGYAGLPCKGLEFKYLDRWLSLLIYSETTQSNSSTGKKTLPQKNSEVLHDTQIASSRRTLPAGCSYVFHGGGSRSGKRKSGASVHHCSGPTGPHGYGPGQS